MWKIFFELKFTRYKSFRTADLEEMQKITPFLDIYSKSVFLIIEIKVSHARKIINREIIVYAILSGVYFSSRSRFEEINYHSIDVNRIDRICKEVRRRTN